jgi:hypothetical protein
MRERRHHFARTRRCGCFFTVRIDKSSASVWLFPASSAMRHLSRYPRYFLTVVSVWFRIEIVSCHHHHLFLPYVPGIPSLLYPVLNPEKQIVHHRQACNSGTHVLWRDPGLIVMGSLEKLLIRAIESLM